MEKKMKKNEIFLYIFYSIEKNQTNEMKQSTKKATKKERNRKLRQHSQRTFVTKKSITTSKK